MIIEIEIELATTVLMARGQEKILQGKLTGQSLAWAASQSLRHERILEEVVIFKTNDRVNALWDAFGISLVLKKKLMRLHKERGLVYFRGSNNTSGQITATVVCLVQFCISILHINN